MEDPKPSGMADSARACAARAWSVIQMQPRGKRPLVSWRGFQQRISGIVVVDVVAELMRAWNRSHCRPPLSDAEVLRVVESVERKHERDRWVTA